MQTHEVYDTEGNLLSRDVVEEPQPEPVSAAAVIESVANMTDDQKAALRAALGLS